MQPTSRTLYCSTCYQVADRPVPCVRQSFWKRITPRNQLLCASGGTAIRRNLSHFVTVSLSTVRCAGWAPDQPLCQMSLPDQAPCWIILDWPFCQIVKESQLAGSCSCPLSDDRWTTFHYPLDVKNTLPAMAPVSTGTRPENRLLAWRSSPEGIA